MGIFQRLSATNCIQRTIFPILRCITLGGCCIKQRDTERLLSVIMLAPEFDVRGFPMTITRQFVIAVSFIILVTIAHAKTTCVFQTNGVAKTMTLVADCTTDTTIQVPAGFTLNGAKHLITAVDPAGGNFNGAVVANEVVDSTINVKNLVIDMPNLATGNCVFVQGISFNQAEYGSQTTTGAVHGRGTNT
jgi:hypothetical protein